MPSILPSVKTLLTLVYHVASPAAADIVIAIAQLFTGGCTVNSFRT